MNWDYARMSHLAKIAGGPRELWKKCFNAGKEQGRKEMYPIVLLIGIVSYALRTLQE